MLFLAPLFPRIKVFLDSPFIVFLGQFFGSSRNSGTTAYHALADDGVSRYGSWNLHREGSRRDPLKIAPRFIAGARGSKCRIRPVWTDRVPRVWFAPSLWDGNARGNVRRNPSLQRLGYFQVVPAGTLWNAAAASAEAVNGPRKSVMNLFCFTAI